MTTTNGNRKILDLKRWEMVTPAPTSTVAGAFIASSRHQRQQQLYVTSATTAWLYYPAEDGWVQVPSPGLAGSFGAGAAGVASGFSIGTATAASQLTATSGTTTTIVTNQTLARDLRGYSIHITGGPNAGVTLVIRSNTIAANATITVDAQASAFSASTTFRLLTPCWYVVGTGTIGSGSFRKYDFATNTWTTLAQTGLPATIGTDGKLVSTPSWMDTGFLAFATGTATAGAASTLTQSTKNWTTNQWTNYQIRITGGTGAGQIRTIASNTATVITVGAAWTTQPDVTSTYSIEGNDDFIYYLGNNAVTLYRYSISANTWTTLSPTAARAAAPTTGMSAHWVWDVKESDWTAENTIRNGQRIYSFRGGAGAVLDYYDITANTWVSGVTYSPATETLTTGTKYSYSENFLYIQKDATGRWFRYNFATSEMDGWNTMFFPNGSALVGDTSFDVTYFDGATEIHYIYMVLNTSTVMLRQQVI
jgi:hypothetical protein